MSKIDVLLKNYEKEITIPWRDAAAAQRVIFAVYPETDERRLRSKLANLKLLQKTLTTAGYIMISLTLLQNGCIVRSIQRAIFKNLI